MFSEEFETRYEELFEMLYACQEKGGNPEKDMPKEWAEYQDMELMYQTEFF